jgi:hypothetical protein
MFRQSTKWLLSCCASAVGWLCHDSIEGLCTSLSPVHVISARFLCLANPPLASPILAFPLCSQWPEQTLQTLATGPGSAMRRHARYTRYTHDSPFRNLFFYLISTTPHNQTQHHQPPSPPWREHVQPTESRFWDLRPQLS